MCARYSSSAVWFGVAQLRRTWRGLSAFSTHFWYGYVHGEGWPRGSQSSWQLWSRDVTVAMASGLQYGRHRENGRFSDREIRANWNIGDIIDARIRCWGYFRCISGAILSKLILFFQKEAMTWSLAPTAIRFISGWPAFHCRLNWHWSFEYCRCTCKRDGCTW